MFYLGIDIGKRTHAASIMDEAGKVLLKGFSFSNSSAGAEALFGALHKFSGSSADFIVGMEATGHYWLALFSYLDEKGFLIHVLNPIQTDGWRNATEIRKRKTDTIDSVLIADLIRYGDFTHTTLTDENVMSLKNLSRYRTYLVGTTSDFKRKVIAVLDQLFPEYETLFNRQGLFGAASKELLLTYSSPESLEEVTADEIAQALKTASRGRLGIDKAEAIKQAASSSFGVRFAQEAYVFQLRSMIEQIKFLENQINEVEKEIKNIMDQLDSVILTVPGIGPVNGAAILGEIGDITRFSTASKLVAYAGIDASVTKSGEYESTHNVMSKRGSPYLRKALFSAAFIASFNDPVFSTYYQKKRAAGKHHLTAVGAVARKLTYTIHAILTKNEPYKIQI
ncbi:IS110 family transposase [Enterococcus sp. CSURQ0835]|uniref:IS110 family transposase n=1 Tax=Enterococcus sp. CSURQ0835 TaxID=2681394 RepID=UPI001356AEB0|nr:IS110 family transposase [Enterococcus sp. CSURQ0835]